MLDPWLFTTEFGQPTNSKAVYPTLQYFQSSVSESHSFIMQHLLVFHASLFTWTCISYLLTPSTGHIQIEMLQPHSEPTFPEFMSAPWSYLNLEGNQNLSNRLTLTNISRERIFFLCKSQH